MEDIQKLRKNEESNFSIIEKYNKLSEQLNELKESNNSLLEDKSKLNEELSKIKNESNIPNNYKEENDKLNKDLINIKETLSKIENENNINKTEKDKFIEENEKLKNENEKIILELNEFKKKYYHLKEENEKNKNIQITKNINIINKDIKDEKEKENSKNIQEIEIITEKIITQEKSDPVIIKKDDENRRPSKFKKVTTFTPEINPMEIADNNLSNPNTYNINNNVNDNKPESNNILNLNEKVHTSATLKEDLNNKNNNKNAFMDKIKMFSQNKEGNGSSNQTKQVEEIKKVKIVEKKVETNKKEENDNAKKQKMNKALQRLKKNKEKKEKEAEASNSAKHELNDPRFKSIRIKNMAELLEGHINSNQQSGDINNNEGIEVEIKKEESETLDMLRDQPGNVVLKRKMTKKAFEES